MKVRNILIVGVLLLFLCGLASAGNGNSYGKSKSGVLFQNEIDTSKITIEKGSSQIKISSNEHSETKIKLSKTDIDSIKGSAEQIKVSHTNDSGIQDWERVITPTYVNGLLELDVEFSTVTITPYTSFVEGWSFETWTDSDTPAGWTTVALGGYDSSAVPAAIGDHAYGITGNGVDAVRGQITQATTLQPGQYVTVGAYIHVQDRTSGALVVDLYSSGQRQVCIINNANTVDYDGWDYVETTVLNTYTNPTIRIYADGTPNTAYKATIDGMFVSLPYSFSVDEVETTTGCTQTLTYSPVSVHSTATYITYMDSFYNENHGKLEVNVKVDGSFVYSREEDNLIYFDVSGLSATSHTVVVTVAYNKAPTLYSPADGSTVTREFPPLYADQIFTWEYVKTTCQIQIAEDSAFSNVVYSHETTSTTATASLAEGTYYWRVRSYDPTEGAYGDYPTSYSVIIVTTTGSIVGTGVAGCVYESQGLGNYQVVSGALATVYNDTYSVTKTTGSEGYYQVLGLSNGTYYVSVKKTGYDASDITPVNVITSEVTVQNIAIQASQSYFAPTDCVIKVKEHWYSFSGVSGVTYAYYQNGDTATLGTGTTDSTGRFTMSDIDIGVRYRIVLTTDDGTQTDYIMPSSSELSFIIVLDLTETSLLPDSQFYDVVNVSVDKEILNSTAAKVTVSWNGTDSSMTGVYYQIGQTANNGTFVVLDDYTETPTGTTGSNSFIVSNYLGESYKIIVEFTEDSFGTVEKTYTVTFAGSTVPFIGGKALSYFGVFLVFIVAMMFGKAEHASGGLMVCGFSWFLWYLDVFTGFGSATNTTMAAGLVIGTVFALLAVVNEARKGANI